MRIPKTHNTEQGAGWALGRTRQGHATNIIAVKTLAFPMTAFSFLLGDVLGMGIREIHRSKVLVQVRRVTSWDRGTVAFS